ncbi:hypothetical protein ACJMK2_012661 [Sinanodonta woodiana]|uniref:ZMYM2-like/QRICH1 C-terminal domain-containing protein n=1 Tax=Sinanodonta woodiana TaxID=1069815 RepID=A0ABD3V949_SINWO
MQKYLSQNGEDRAIESIPLKTLDDYISAFLNTGRKKDGSEYSYASLRSFLSTLERYLRQKNVFQGSIFQGIHFQKCRSVLKVKKMLCGPSKTRDFGEITEAALDHLYKTGYLGMSTPSALINSMLIICYQSFGLKTGVEMYTLRWKDLQVGVDEYGKEFLAYVALPETASPNIQWSNNFLRVYATSKNPNMDPVALYRMYAKKRPDDMCEPKSPFFLAYNPRASSYDADALWYKTTAMGIKALYSTMNDIRAQLCIIRRH